MDGGRREPALNIQVRAEWPWASGRSIPRPASFNINNNTSTCPNYKGELKKKARPPRKPLAD
jgi:hypothetical protein